MHPEFDAASLIGLDWGTSSLRGWLLGSNGRVLDRREAALGILAVRDGRFAETFASFCAPWLAGRPGLPIIASGMIGSRQGWREAAYLRTPVSLDALADGLLAIDELAGRPFRIVPGLVTRRPGGSPDVLRGEETQVFGALGAGEGEVGPGATGGRATDEPATGDRAADERAAAEQRLFVLPGTHSKWIATRGSAVTDFRSCMTGELFAVLREHSILGRLFAEPADPDADAPMAAFDDGVDRVLAEPGAFGHLIFMVRTEGLLGERPADCLPAYLSGLLIGAEIGDALRVFGNGSGKMPAAPTIVASPAIATRYRRALIRAGVDAVVADGEPASAGLFALAARAGLLDRTPGPDRSDRFGADLTRT